MPKSTAKPAPGRKAVRRGKDRSRISNPTSGAQSLADTYEDWLLEEGKRAATIRLELEFLARLSIIEATEFKDADAAKLLLILAGMMMQWNVALPQPLSEYLGPKLIEIGRGKKPAAALGISRSGRPQKYSRRAIVIAVMGYIKDKGMTLADALRAVVADLDKQSPEGVDESAIRKAFHSDLDRAVFLRELQESLSPRQS